MCRITYGFFLGVYLLVSSSCLNALAQNEVNYELYDPTQPLYHEVIEREERSLVLQKIFFDGSRQEAIVNGVRVKVGDTVDEKKIIDIKKNEIVYEFRGSTKVLKLRSSAAKK